MAVTVVVLVHNRRDELRETLSRMQDAGDVVVVDNASTDGSAEMVREEFPRVRLIRRERNSGVSGFNDGFAAAGGEWVLALDDDCWLELDDLHRALAAAGEHDADLVSFGVRSAVDPTYRFDHAYRTGLLAFWGCAVLIRRSVLERLGGYDPQIFVWANEVEFMLRFFDAGFRHLHLPDVVAVHMKPPPEHWTDYVRSPNYRRNVRNWAYVAAKHLRARHAAGTLVALLAVALRDALSVDRRAIAVAPAVFEGFAAGLRQRTTPVREAVSRGYRHNFESFASPWRTSRPPGELIRALPRDLARAATGRAGGDEPAVARDYYAKRERYYPDGAATLDFDFP